MDGGILLGKEDVCVSCEVRILLKAWGTICLSERIDRLFKSKDL